MLSLVKVAFVFGCAETANDFRTYDICKYHIESTNSAVFE